MRSKVICCFRPRVVVQTVGSARGDDGESSRSEPCPLSPSDPAGGSWAERG